MKNRRNFGMKKFVCSVCGYVYVGEKPPEKCPVCGAPSDKFVEKPEDSSDWATEHKVGIAKGVDPKVLEGLKSNFTGECSEVGMYLAMSRQADREGYPEAAELFKRVALEEAGHASRFAELVGEVLVPDTKKNLQMRVDAEAGACKGKENLANLAKKLKYDDIHDTVHEMAKDEARHGAAFRGLLNRYFK